MKLTFRAQQRSEELRAKYLTDVSVFESEMLVFVDKMGSDKRATLQVWICTER